MNKLLITTACLCFAAPAPAGALFAAPLPQTGTIIGHVRDAKGKPLAHILVEIMRTGEFAVTDKDGAYLFTGEDPGLYMIKADGAKYRHEVLTVTVQPGTTATLELVLEPCTLAPGVFARNTKSDGAMISVVTSQKRRVPPDSFLDDPIATFPGDSSLHSTVRSR